jgi:hypothetical protein
MTYIEVPGQLAPIIHHHKHWTGDSNAKEGGKELEMAELLVNIFFFAIEKSALFSV